MLEIVNISMHGTSGILLINKIALVCTLRHIKPIARAFVRVRCQPVFCPRSQFWHCIKNLSGLLHRCNMYIFTCTDLIYSFLQLIWSEQSLITTVMHQPALSSHEEGMGFLDLQIVHRSGFLDGVNVPDFTQRAVRLFEFVPNFQVSCPHPLVTQIRVALGFGSGFTF